MHNLTSILRCVACARDDDGEQGWRLYLIPNDPPWIAAFCPECAEREVGDDER
jgi:hypothetical protein